MDYHKVPVYLRHTITKIGDGVATLKSRDSGETFEVEFDNIVNGIGFVPAPLASAGKKNVYKIGDCKAIGNLRTVIWGAWAACMKINGNNEGLDGLTQRILGARD